MQIEELNRSTCINLLAKLRFGRLACAKGSQPYVVPIFYAYNDGYVYSFSTRRSSDGPTSQTGS